MNTEGYVTVYTHKGYAIQTLKNARPAEGDRLGYVIGSEMFEGKRYDRVADAMDDIDRKTAE